MKLFQLTRQEQKTLSVLLLLLALGFLGLIIL